MKMIPDPAINQKEIEDGAAKALDAAARWLAQSRSQHLEQTPEQTAAIEEAIKEERKRILERQLATYGCSDGHECIEMDYICALNQGDEEARGSTSLYQCPECKTIREI